jgi:tRNA threonylcarbamoyl adenosine modification protein (Sua5/YciO/YrdC/YwlC family)
VARIRKGAVIAVPTDTIYGLACDAHSDDAVRQLYRIKQRPASNPLAICVADISDIYKWCRVTVSQQLLQLLLPGQVTLVFERLENLNKNLNPDSRTIAVRIPDCDFVRSVCRESAVPLALSSANISASESCLSVEEFSSLWPQIDRVYDAGSLHRNDPLRLGSTIIDLSKSGHFTIRRDGCAHSAVVTALCQFNLISLPAENGK